MTVSSALRASSWDGAAGGEEDCGRGILLLLDGCGGGAILELLWERVGVALRERDCCCWW